MPTYEYKCSCCGHSFDVEQRITDAPLETCEKCKVTALKRLISGSSFTLKGDGWAKDLYAKAKK